MTLQTLRQGETMNTPEERQRASDLLDRVLWHVVNGNVEWVWSDEDVLDETYKTLRDCQIVIWKEATL